MRGARRLSRPGITPACWTPPETLPDLPEGEAVREQPWEVYGAPATYPPQTAPGYRRAAQLGLLPPPPPPSPPAPVPGLSSWDRTRLSVVLCFGGILLALLLGNWFELEAAAGVVGAGAFGTGMWMLYSTRRRDDLEHAAGYTSGVSATGLWRLARDGRVLRAPDPAVPPPGWYPSPYFPGVLQVWDGPGWKPLLEWWWRYEHRYFRRPDIPFL